MEYFCVYALAWSLTWLRLAACSSAWRWIKLTIAAYATISSVKPDTVSAEDSWVVRKARRQLASSHLHCAKQCCQSADSQDKRASCHPSMHFALKWAVNRPKGLAILPTSKLL